MPRRPQYDKNDILTTAVDVFLEHGFQAAIMDEIIARTDFNRRGFYLEFGSKKQFLYEVLTHYRAQQLLPVLATLNQNNGLSSIQAFFQDYIALIQGRGCLLINMVTELGFDDGHIRELGRHYLDELQIAFIACLEKALRTGQIREQIQLEATALQLTSYVQGFAVNAILATDAEELHLATQALLGPLAA